MNQIHVGRNGAALGVFSEEEVRAGLASGKFLLSDLGWRSGEPQWTPLGEWPEFAPLNAPPPVIVSVPGEPENPEPAWERRKELGVWAAFWRSIFGILFSPAKTFSAMPKQSGFGAAYVFYLIPAAFFGVIGQLIQLLLQLKYTETWLASFSDWVGDEQIRKIIEQYLRRQAEIPEGVRQMTEAVQIAWTIIGGIIGAAIGIFITAGITHLLLMLFRGAKYPFITTFKTCAYVTGAFACIQWIPGIGTLLWLTWELPLLIIALSKAHEIPWKKSAFAVLSPVFFCCCIYAGIVGFAIMLVKNGDGNFRHSYPPARHTTIPATPSQSPAQPAPVSPDEDEEVE